MMILNHCHIGPEGYFQKVMSESGPWNDGSLPRLALVMKDLGFDQAVVFAPFKLWHEGDPNAWMFDQCAGDPRFIPWITVNHTGPAALAELSAGLARGARGIKFHPPIIGIAPDDPGLEDFYGLAQEKRLPVLFHAGPHGWDLDKYRPARLGKVAARFPDLPIICEHLGGNEFCNETWEVMASRPNVYGGLASCLLPTATWHIHREVIARAVEKFGPGRFIFGADFPYNGLDYLQRCLAVLEGLKLPGDGFKKVLSTNLESLLQGVR